MTPRGELDVARHQRHPEGLGEGDVGGVVAGELEPQGPDAIGEETGLMALDGQCEVKE